MIQTLDELIALAKKTGFKNLDVIRSVARAGYLLSPSAVDSAADSASTRLGGLPALPASSPWPVWRGRSLSFIGQINLGRLPSREALPWLPQAGILQFFYDNLQETWGFDPADKGSFELLYLETVSENEFQNWPEGLSVEGRFGNLEMQAEETYFLPPLESLLISYLNLNQKQEDAYLDLLNVLAPDETWAERCILGGYPDQIQNDMMLECAMIEAGLYLGDVKAYQDPRMSEFRRRALSWRLILQVPSIQSIGMTWGDAGCLYYCMDEHAIQERRFDQAWMTLQCA